MTTKGEEEASAIRAILKSELTWLVFVIATMMGIVTTIVLPLQKVQLDIANISLQLSESKLVYDQIETRIGRLELSDAKNHSK